MFETRGKLLIAWSQSSCWQIFDAGQPLADGFRAVIRPGALDCGRSSLEDGVADGSEIVGLNTVLFLVGADEFLVKFGWVADEVIRSEYHTFDGRPPPL